jgi:hypothetical protein
MLQGSSLDWTRVLFIHFKRQWCKNYCVNMNLGFCSHTLGGIKKIEHIHQQLWLAPYLAHLHMHYTNNYLQMSIALHFLPQSQFVYVASSLLLVPSFERSGDSYFWVGHIWGNLRRMSPTMNVVTLKTKQELWPLALSWRFYKHLFVPSLRKQSILIVEFSGLTFLPLRST